MINLFYKLEAQKNKHSAWKLLRSDHAPLILCLVQKTFIEPNIRTLPQSRLVETLESLLLALRESMGEEAFPQSALTYLNDWAQQDKGWLRKFYQQGNDEPYFDITPATEKAILWIEQLEQRQFVGTESRMLTVFELLKQIVEGSETDPETRIAELQRQREQLQEEIHRIQRGQWKQLDDTAVKDRLQLFSQVARELLSDFREVEYNFRQLDRKVREDITLWDGSKGALIDKIMGEHDLITDSDQGKSFQAFWDFLLSQSRQDDLSILIEKVQQLPVVESLPEDVRLKRLQFDWLEAGGHTQKTVAQLSQQLRKFLDDRAWLENKRIMDIIRNIETQVLLHRNHPVKGNLMSLPEVGIEMNSTMERTLYVPKAKPLLKDPPLEIADENVDASALFSQSMVNKEQLIQQIEEALTTTPQVSLFELTQKYPLQYGLAELITYLQIGCDHFQSILDENHPESIEWTSTTDLGEVTRSVVLPRTIFIRLPAS